MSIFDDKYKSRSASTLGPQPETIIGAGLRAQAEIKVMQEQWSNPMSDSGHDWKAVDRMESLIEGGKIEPCKKR